MLPSVFDSSEKESAARDLDVEVGVNEESGRLPGVWDAHAGGKRGRRGDEGPAMQRYRGCTRWATGIGMEPDVENGAQTLETAAESETLT